MNIKDLKSSLPYLFEAQLTAFLWGRAGIGKSGIVKQYADEKGYKFFPFYLGTQSDIGDILGIPEFVRDANGVAVSVKHAIPEWLREMIEYCDNNPDSGAIIFLDEFNRGRRDIINGCFSLALDKTFHTVRLPKNCYVIAAGNPPTADYVTTDVDETALMARFVHVKLEPTFDEWVEFAKSTNMNDSLVQFVRQQPDLLEGKSLPFELPVNPDRRAYSRLDRLFTLNTPEHLLSQLMVGIIGLERTVAYQTFLKDQDKPLTADQILNGDRMDLIKKWSNVDEVSGALLSVTTDNLIAFFNEKKEVTGFTLSDDQKENFFKFLMALPKDIMFKTVRTLLTPKNPLFKDFCDTRKKYEKKLQDVILGITLKVKEQAA